jgi:hypothetical protein
MKTLVDLGGMKNPRPLALKADIGDYYTRLDAIQVAINGVEAGIPLLSDKGGHIKWGNIVGKPAASLTVAGVVTLSNTPSTDKTKGATLASLRTANSDGWGFVPQERCINGIALNADINMVADDLWTFTKAQVDALAAKGAKVKGIRFGTPVQSALNAVPAANYITSFGGPGQPVWSRPLQFQIRQDDGTLVWTDIRRTA